MKIAIRDNQKVAGVQRFPSMRSIKERNTKGVPDITNNKGIVGETYYSTIILLIMYYKVSKCFGKEWLLVYFTERLEEKLSNAKMPSSVKENVMSDLHKLKVNSHHA